MEYESSLSSESAPRTPAAAEPNLLGRGVAPEAAAPGSAPAISQARRLTPDELAARDAALAGGAAVIAGTGAPKTGPDGTHEPYRSPRPSPTTGLGPEPDEGPRQQPRRRGRRAALVVGLLLLAFVAVAGGAAAYLLLPEATIVLTIKSTPLPPVVFIVTADPAATVADPAAAVVPAIRVDLPLAASGTFKATGKRVDEAPAVGSVQWTNCDPTQAYTIPQGTLVRTGAGVAFGTNEAVFLPVAILNPPRITCQNRAVAITAAKPGPAGNVAAGTITVIPGQYNSVVITVRNLAATSGGTHTEFPKVTQKDVTAALAGLGKQLDAQLAVAAAAPTGLAAGTTAFPDTASRGPATPSVDPASLVDQEVAQFDLAATATGTVVAVDQAPILALGQDRLTVAVPVGREMVAGSAAVSVGPGAVDGQRVHFSVTARADTTPTIDEATIRAQLKGRSAADAQAYLAPYGDATVTLWPGWATTIPTFDARVDLRVVGLTIPSPVPSSSGLPSVSPAASGSPSSSLFPVPPPRRARSRRRALPRRWPARPVPPRPARRAREAPPRRRPGDGADRPRDRGAGRRFGRVPWPRSIAAARWPRMSTRSRAWSPRTGSPSSSSACRSRWPAARARRRRRPAHGRSRSPMRRPCPSPCATNVSPATSRRAGSVRRSGARPAVHPAPPGGRRTVRGSTARRPS